MGILAVFSSGFPVHFFSRNSQSNCFAHCQGFTKLGLFVCMGIEYVGIHGHIGSNKDY